MRGAIWRLLQGRFRGRVGGSKAKGTGTYGEVMVINNMPSLSAVFRQLKNKSYSVYKKRVKNQPKRNQQLPPGGWRIGEAPGAGTGPTNKLQSVQGVRPGFVEALQLCQYNISFFKAATHTRVAAQHSARRRRLARCSSTDGLLGIEWPWRVRGGLRLPDPRPCLSRPAVCWGGC